MVRSLIPALAALAAGSLAAGCASTPDITPHAPNADDAARASADAQEENCGGAMRRLIPVLGNMIWRCVSAPEDALEAKIARDVALTLPMPPAYPETTTIVQTGHARYGERQAAFEAVLSLAPDRAEIVLTMLGGPRLATIVWDNAGIYEDRALFVPKSVPVENIVADIFVTVWPAEAVKASLPEGTTLTVAEDGGRTISRGDEMIVTATPSPADSNRTVVRNIPFGYEVAIVSQSLGS
jgi:hypothetical protein